MSIEQNGSESTPKRIITCMFTRCLFEDEVNSVLEHEKTKQQYVPFHVETPTHTKLPSLLPVQTSPKRKRSQGDANPNTHSSVPQKKVRRTSTEFRSQLIGCCGASNSSGQTTRFDHFMTQETSTCLLKTYSDHVIKNRIRTITDLEEFQNQNDLFDDVSIQKMVQLKGSDGSSTVGECIVCSCVAKTVFLLMIHNRLPCYSETNANQKLDDHSTPVCYFSKTREWFRERKGESNVDKSLRNFCIDCIIPPEKPIVVSMINDNRVPINLTGESTSNTNVRLTLAIPNDPTTLYAPPCFINRGADHRHTVKKYDKDDVNPGVFHEDGLPIGYISPEWTSAKPFWLARLNSNGYLKCPSAKRFIRTVVSLIRGFVDSPIDFITKNDFLCSRLDNKNHLGLHTNFTKVIYEGIAIESDCYMCPGCGIRFVPRGKSPSMLRNINGCPSEIYEEAQKDTKHQNNFTLHMNSGSCNLLGFVLIRLQIVVMRRLIPYFIQPSEIDKRISIRLCRLWGAYIAALGKEHTVEHNYRDEAWSNFDFHLPIAFSWAEKIEKNIYAIPSPGGKKPRIYDLVDQGHISPPNTPPSSSEEVSPFEEEVDVAHPPYVELGLMADFEAFDDLMDLSDLWS